MDGAYWSGVQGVTYGEAEEDEVYRRVLSLLSPTTHEQCEVHRDGDMKMWRHGRHGRYWGRKVERCSKWRRMTCSPSGNLLTSRVSVGLTILGGGGGGGVSCIAVRTVAALQVRPVAWLIFAKEPPLLPFVFLFFFCPSSIFPPSSINHSILHLSHFPPFFLHLSRRRKKEAERYPMVRTESGL